jgi:hypothetical protein
MSGPFCVKVRDRPRTRPRTKRQQNRAGASIEGDQTYPSRKARKPLLPRAFLRAQDRFRGAHAGRVR